MATKETLDEKAVQSSERVTKKEKFQARRDAKKAQGATEGRAKLSYCRMSPRKVKLVLDLIRGQSVEKAAAILKYTPKAASEPVGKLLHSAVANAELKALDPKHMYVAECFVTPGPTLKRVRPRAQGRAFRILKRTSHITVVVKEKQ